ncbi:MAG: hypothetical protein JSS78_08950 [Bacteroidetes bacterium]|nr:hypothetical protein [Bacteroidota bacterium]
MVLAFNMAGTPILFKARQYSIKQEIKQQLLSNYPAYKLHPILVSNKNKHEIIWQEKNEFSYQGKMYDVAFANSENDSCLIYWCIEDHEETNLYAGLNEIVSRTVETDRTSGQTAKRLFKFLSELFLPEQSIAVYLVNRQQLPHLILPHSPYHSPWIDLFQPPPKFLS